MRAALAPRGVIVEPEGHMVADKRADITISVPGHKIPVELKRDYHVDVWGAAETQLDRLYTRDPEASGYGIYCVLWFGSKRGSKMASHPTGKSAPKSAAEMEAMLIELVPADKRARIAIVVVDVSGTTA
jgi:hypothetical protein